MPAPIIEYKALDSEAAGHALDELAALFTEVYAEPPYEWGPEHADLFRERFAVQRRQPGFALITARTDGELAGLGFGVTLQTTTPWWHNLTTPLPAEVTREYSGRTWALVELLVHTPWRRHHIAQTIHHRLLADRPEQRATLTVLPAAAPAQAAYTKWGWHKIAQKRNPLPGSPVFDVMIKALHPTP